MSTPLDKLTRPKSSTQRFSELEEAIEHLQLDLERVRHGYARRLKWVLGMLFILILATFAQSYQGREAVISSSRHGCKLSVLDREDMIRLRTIQAQTDQAISQDPRQPAVTRRARAHQAAVERQSVQDLRTRVPPSISCSSGFPKASPLPWG